VSKEHDGEPVRGLPEHLPAGEHILWQGAPDWRVLARTALHTPWIALYFGALIAWNLASGLIRAEPAMTVLMQMIMSVAVGSACLGLLYGYAWLNARTTVYTLTNRRFVLRHGVALSKCFNIPYAAVAAAGLKVDKAGVGDNPLTLSGDNKIAYPHLWPHARPWRIGNPQPMMRAVPDAAAVADRLSQALQQAAREADRPFVAEPARGPAERPVLDKNPNTAPAAA
jgi:hypothetical protein